MSVGLTFILCFKAKTENYPNIPLSGGQSLEITVFGWGETRSLGIWLENFFMINTFRVIG